MARRGVGRPRKERTEGETAQLTLKEARKKARLTRASAKMKARKITVRAARRIIIANDTKNEILRTVKMSDSKKRDLVDKMVRTTGSILFLTVEKEVLKLAKNLLRKWLNVWLPKRFQNLWRGSKPPGRGRGRPRKFREEQNG